MKNLFFLLLTTAFLFSCSPDESAKKIVCEGSASLPTLPPTTYEALTLLNGKHWVFEFYVLPEFPELQKANKGRWFVFNQDGTFTSGVWDQEGCGGTYLIYNNPEYNKPLIYLDSENDSEDTEFEIQSSTKERDAMGWVGTSRFHKVPPMIKVIALDSRPTKEQFGVE